jgi:AraC-like DNA-binding protein
MSDIAEFSLNQHSTLVSVAALVVDALDSYGLAFRPILEESGLDADKVYDPSGRIPILKYKKLWELSVQYSGDPCFGLTYAAYIQPSSLHGLGLSWIASHSLKDGLERLVRFQRILSTDQQLGLRETQTGYCVYDAVGQKDDPIQFPDAAYDSQVASIYKICQIMLGPDIKPIRVSVEHPAPPCKERFEQFFRIPVNFDASETAIEFAKEISELPVSSANPELTRINDQIVIDYLNQFEQDDIVTQTRKFIIDHLPSGVPRQAIIASNLNLSLRNFQRKLAQSGTSFTDVLSHVRHEMACYYLKAPNHPIIEISYLLGFTDSSNFSRAFKRWNGQSPNHFRQAYLQQKLT